MRRLGQPFGVVLGLTWLSVTWLSQLALRRSLRRLDLAEAAQLHRIVEPVAFTAAVRFWNQEKQSGLAVLDVPAEHVAELGGLRQQRVHGTLNGADFTSNVMPAGGGRLAMSVSKALMKTARASVGDSVEVTIRRVGRDPD